MSHPHEIVAATAAFVVPAIELIALTVIAIGTVEAFVRSLGALLAGSEQGDLFSPVWLRYARWLIGGLTFQLAADIIATSASPSWEEIGKLGAVAAIRTFLNFFLERDRRDLAEEARREAALSAAIR